MPLADNSLTVYLKFGQYTNIINVLNALCDLSTIRRCLNWKIFWLKYDWESKIIYKELNPFVFLRLAAISIPRNVSRDSLGLHSSHFFIPLH